MSLLAYDFMQRALVAAVLTGLAAPAIGTYLVQKRLALLGDGIGHIALTGVALGLLTGRAPLLTAVLVAVAGATLIELLRLRGRASGDVALALFFYGGIAAGVLLTGLAGGSAATLTSYLFGALTTVSNADLVLVAVLAGLVLAVSLGLAPQLFAVCQDEEHARVAGLRVGAYSVLISVLAAVTVTLAMRTVGLLLVSALMVVPVAAAQQLTRAFRATLALAMSLGVVAAVSGVWASFYADTAPGPTIVLLALAGFVLASPAGGWLRRSRRVHTPFEEDDAPTGVVGAAGGVAGAGIAVGAHDRAEHHPHRHGEGCGHLAVEHGDHVDYVHDGHRHVPHDDHYDEH
ncbi:metal ABC transporter permease [soil metagenome]